MTGKATGSAGCSINALQSLEQSPDSALQMLVRNVVLRDARDCRSNLFEDIGEQSKVHVDVDRFPDILRTRSLQQQRDALIERGLKSRRTFKGAAVELVWIFQRNLGLVDDWFGHRILVQCLSSCLRTTTGYGDS